MISFCCRRLRSVPGSSLWECGTGSASLVWCPGTPESSASPPLPARPSLPTDPGSAGDDTDRDEWVEQRSLFTVAQRYQLLPPLLSASSSPQTAAAGWAPPAQSGRGSPALAETQWSGQIWTSAGSKETGGKTRDRKCDGQSLWWRQIVVWVFVCVTLLLLSSRHLEMMESRKTSWAAMMWSRSCACCTLFHSSSQQHSSTYTHTEITLLYHKVSLSLNHH